MSADSNFWSRRRAAVAEEERRAQAAVEAEEIAQQHAELEQETDAEILEKLNLPDPDTLEQGDDFTAFMAKAVPDRIRRRALRKLWLSNPVLANVDMLVDYGEDFTDSATVIENLQTTYQVGKGMLKHVQEMARQAEEAERVANGEAEPEPEPQDDEIEEQDTLLAEAEDPAPDYHFDDGDEELETVAAPSPRRMKFRTEATA